MLNIKLSATTATKLNVRNVLPLQSLSHKHLWTYPQTQTNVQSLRMNEIVNYLHIMTARQLSWLLATLTPPPTRTHTQTGQYQTVWLSATWTWSVTCSGPYPYEDLRCMDSTNTYANTNKCWSRVLETIHEFVCALLLLSLSALTSTLKWTALLNMEHATATLSRGRTTLIAAAAKLITIKLRISLAITTIVSILMQLCCSLMHTHMQGCMYLLYIYVCVCNSMRVVVCVDFKYAHKY